jgi:hypothetical protein
MESVTGAKVHGDTCDGCLKASLNLTNSTGDRICDKCKAVFLTAAVLLNEGITAEDTLIPTLVFAKSAGGSAAYATLVRERAPATGLDLVRLIREAQGRSTKFVETEGYAGWELVDVIRGVPILRVLPLAAVPKSFPGTQALQSIRIQVLSRHVKPDLV